MVVVSEKGEVRFNALANDRDPDHGDTIRVVGLFSLGSSYQDTSGKDAAKRRVSQNPA